MANPHGDLTDAKLGKAIDAANAKAAALYAKRDKALAAGQAKQAGALNGQIAELNVERDELEREELRRLKAAADAANPDRGVTIVRA